MLILKIMENPIYCGSPKFKNWRYIEIIIENQEVDNVTKLQLVQPLSFGDTVLCYHRKIKQLILGRYCRYHKIFEAWSIADFQARFS